MHRVASAAGFGLMGSNPIPTSVSSHSGLVHRLGKSAGETLASSNLALTSGGCQSGLMDQSRKLPGVKAPWVRIPHHLLCTVHLVGVAALIRRS